MNFLKKGPELKLSGLKVPDFLFDLYYDLKERHLLPLVAVLAVALVVVPIALSRAGSSESEAQEGAVATRSTAGDGAGTLAVARSAPGLRDYRRRLEDAHALDPFRPQAEAATAAAASSAEAAAPTTEAPPSSGIAKAPSAPLETPVESLPPVGAPSGSESGGGPSVVTETKTETKYATQTLDVRIVTVPKQDEGAKRSQTDKARKKPQARVRRDLPELTMLPSRATPVAIFMGASSDGKKALLLVSSDVQSVFGDGQCVIGSQTCQLLALEKGTPETFVYGPQARTYRIEILAIGQSLTSKPHRASFGKPRGGKDGEAGAEPPGGAARVSAAQPR